MKYCLEYDIYPLTKSNEKARNPRTGRYFLSKKYKKYEEDLKWITIQQLGMSFEALTGDVSVWLTFTFNNKRCPDLGNLQKSFLDAMQGIAFENDKQITELHLKRYIRAGVEPGIKFEFTNDFIGR